MTLLQVLAKHARQSPRLSIHEHPAPGVRFAVLLQWGERWSRAAALNFSPEEIDRISLTEWEAWEDYIARCVDATLDEWEDVKGPTVIPADFWARFTVSDEDAVALASGEVPFLVVQRRGDEFRAVQGVEG